jgi:hypothetical protein
MAVESPARPVTLEETFSFYVPSSDVELIESCAELADAVTVKGPNGPATVGGMRARGWEGRVIFDRACYNPNVSEVDAERWFDEQARAGADRLLTAGSWVEWDPTGDTLKRAIEIEAERTSSRPDATGVVAIDHRWLTKAPMDLARAVADLDRPVALVLAHPTDPLSVANAVHGLVAVTKNVANVSILRTDHGGLGAIVYGARHAAIGLIPSYRHFVPVGKSGGGKTDDPTARVFVRQMMDWFTAMTIAGWGTVAWDLRCQLDCCRGQRLDRFFDPRFDLEAMVHNRTNLTQLADDILDAPREERRRLFGQMCSEAIDRYGPMGKLSMVTKPKAQLVQWAFV